MTDDRSVAPRYTPEQLIALFQENGWALAMADEGEPVDPWQRVAFILLAKALDAAAPDELRTALAEALKEYDAGRIQVPGDPGRAVPEGGKPKAFHRRWADALLDHATLHPAGAPEPGE